VKLMPPEEEEDEEDIRVSFDLYEYIIAPMTQKVKGVIDKDCLWSASYFIQIEP